MSAAPLRVEVVIDELVLHGFPAEFRETLAEALQSELTSSLTGWHPRQGSALDYVNGGSIRLRRDAAPEEVGRQVGRQARLVLAEISRSASDPHPRSSQGIPSSATPPPASGASPGPLGGAT